MVPRRAPQRTSRRGTGWRLALDVAPVANANESHEDVVGDLFLQAATQGLTVHTRRRSVPYDVTKEESATRRKRLKLTTNRTYRVALAGFTVGELEAVFSTSRAECRMGMVRLAAFGGGYNSAQSGARRVTLGDAEYRRRPPDPPRPRAKTQKEKGAAKGVKGGVKGGVKDGGDAERIGEGDKDGDDAAKDASAADSDLVSSNGVGGDATTTTTTPIPTTPTTTTTSGEPPSDHASPGLPSRRRLRG